MPGSASGVGVRIVNKVAVHIVNKVAALHVVNEVSLTLSSSTYNTVAG